MTKLNKTALCIFILAVAILGISANIYLKNKSTAHAKTSQASSLYIITIEDAKQIAYSKVKEYIQNNWTSTYLTDFKDYKYSATKRVFNGTLVWNVTIEGIKRFDGSEVEYTVKISCSNGQVIFSDITT